MHEIDELFAGSIDLHMHAGPDIAHEPQFLRRVDAAEAAEQARAAGQRAIVLKSHQYHTAPLATLMAKLVPGLTIVGGVALNAPVGGLNPGAVELSAKLGGKMVWMPTISSANHRRLFNQPGGISLLQDDKLKPEVGEILDLVQQYDLVLCTGHTGPQDGLALIREARKRGIKRMIGTHPIGFYGGYNDAQTAELAELGAFVEFNFVACLPTSKGPSVDIFATQIRALGAERCVVTTDCGQIGAPPPSEGLRMAIAALLSRGLTRDEVDLLVRRNPARLLGLED